MRRRSAASSRRCKTEARRAASYALIAEVKKASPSKGLIRADFNPSEIARAYELGGADLPLGPHRPPELPGRAELPDRGARRDAAAGAAQGLPVRDLPGGREPRAWGADCILIILAAVGDDTARYLLDAAAEWRMDALVEVHDQIELDRALALDAEFIGINNRNLRTFETTLQTSIDLAIGVPAGVHLVSESGINNHADLERLDEQAGIGTFLVGESLMRQDDVTARHAGPAAGATRAGS